MLSTTRKRKPITINQEVRNSVESFKKRLIEMAEQPDETSEFDARTVDIILNELDDYDRNIILAYYAIANTSPTILSNYLGISRQLIQRNIIRIIKQIKKLNDVPKSNFNMPRECIDY